MAEPVFGTDVVLEMVVEGDYVPILCGTDCEFRRIPEIIEKTTTTSGISKEFDIRREEFEATLSGLTRIENTAGALTFFYMLQTSVRRTEQAFRMTFADSDGNSKQITFNALIGQESITGPAGDFSQCSIALKGTGSFSIDAVTPPDPSDFDVLSDYWTTVNGQNYISGASAINAYTLLLTDEPLEVDMEGTQYDLVAGTPAVGSRECRFSTSPVRIIFPSDLTFTGAQRVFVMFKRT